MSKVKKAVKSVTKVISNVVPDQLKPVVKIGLAFVPGVGPALSAAYTAADAYGSGASLGNALGQGAKSFAISQVAGAASRSLGLTTSGNDLTDALGKTKGEGLLGLGSGTSGASSTLGGGVTSAASKVASASGSTVASTAADDAFSAAAKASSTSADSAFISAARTAAATAPSSVAEAGGGLLSFGNVSKVAAVAGGLSAASSLLSGGAKAPTAPTGGITDTAQLNSDAATAAEEEFKRRRRGSGSNIYTSPLGLGNGQSAASQLLG